MPVIRLNHCCWNVSSISLSDCRSVNVSVAKVTWALTTALQKRSFVCFEAPLHLGSRAARDIAAIFMRALIAGVSCPLASIILPKYENASTGSRTAGVGVPSGPGRVMCSSSWAGVSS